MMSGSEAVILLADTAVKVTLILAAGFAGAWLLRRASARARHGLWAATLLGALVMPVLSLTLPGWSLPLLPSLHGASPQSENEHYTGVMLLPGPTITESPPVAGLQPERQEGALEVDKNLGRVAAGWWSQPNWSLILLAVWVLGALLVVLRLAHGLGRLRAGPGAAAAARGPGTRRLLERLIPDLGLQRPVRVLRSEHLDVPITWGWLRPVALLPAASDTWSSERRRIVLLHELLHVRYADWPVQVAAQLACALYWFHPLTWLAARRLQVEREQACDESVLVRGTRPSEYATHLLEIAGAMAPGAASPAMGLSMAHRRELERRLLTMLNRRRPIRRTFLPVAGAILCMSALVVSVSAVEPWRAPEPPAPPTPASLALPATPEAAAPVLMPPPVAAVLAVTSPTPAVPAGVVSNFHGTVHNRNGDYLRVGHEGSDFVLEKVDGDFKLRLQMEEPETVEFSRDHSEIVRMGRRASVLIKTSTEDTWQRLEITRDGEGDLRHDWTVNGEERAFNDEGREWLGLALQVAHGIREATELRGRQSSLRGQISSIKGQRSSLRGKISSINGQRSSLNGQISSIKGHVSSKRGQVSSIRGHASSLRGRMSSIRGHESSLRGKISSLRGEISSLKSQRRRSRTDDAEMNRLADELNQRIDGKIADLQDRIQEVEREIDDYDADARVHEVERELAEYDAEARVRAVESELEEYDAEARIREVEREIESFDVKGHVRAIEQQIEELDVEGRVRAIEREIEDLNADERADEINRRTRPLYDDLRRMSRRLDARHRDTR